MTTTTINLVRLANAEVGIEQACRVIEMFLPDFEIGSVKLYCPFGELYHADGGRSKSLRVYAATRSAYCFAGCGSFTPTRLVSMDRGISEEEAAELLLETIGWKPQDVDERWSQITAEAFTLDRTAEGDALRLFCRRKTTRWSDLQFDEGVNDALSKCLAALAKVQSDNELTKWRSVTRDVMMSILEREEQHD